MAVDLKADLVINHKKIDHYTAHGIPFGITDGQDGSLYQMAQDIRQYRL